MACCLKCWIFLSFLIIPVLSCGYPGSMSHANVSFSTEDIRPGTEARYSCEPGFEILGPTMKTCLENGTWLPMGLPFCLLNVAPGKPCLKSWKSTKSAAYKMALQAVDGDLITCVDARPPRKSKPWLFVNLQEPFNVKLVRIDFGHTLGNDTKLSVRVGNSRPDRNENSKCDDIVDGLGEDKTVYVSCVSKQYGAFVSIHLEEPSKKSLKICEIFVYTDDAVPIEACPSFHDQPLGSMTTFNGKCYTFYSEHLVPWTAAHNVCSSHEGSLIDESSSSMLRGFLSWELIKRHRSDRIRSQYWLGTLRARNELGVGNESLWTSFGSSVPENCVRLDGTRGSEWVETNCSHKLPFICQNRPSGCGRPAQPPNSSLNATDFSAGHQVSYGCDEGFLREGPEVRTCLETGRYTQYPPYCRDADSVHSGNDSLGQLFSTESIRNVMIGGTGSLSSNLNKPTHTALLGTGELVAICVFGGLVSCVILAALAVFLHRCHNLRKRGSTVESFNSGSTYESSQTTKQIEAQIAAVGAVANLQKENRMRGLTM